jgi:hypothetical protein
LTAYYWAISDLLHPIFLVFGTLDVLFLIGFVIFLIGERSRQMA